MAAELITLKTGRVVAKGLLPTLRGRLSAAFNPLSKARMRSLPAPPASVVNSVGMTLDPLGNGGLPDPADNSYTGQPMGDCTIAMVANLLMCLSVCTGLTGAAAVPGQNGCRVLSRPHGRRGHRPEHHGRPELVANHSAVRRQRERLDVRPERRREL